MAKLPLNKTIEPNPQPLRREDWVLGCKAADAVIVQKDDGTARLTITRDFSSLEDAQEYLREKGYRFITGANLKRKRS